MSSSRGNARVVDFPLPVNLLRLKLGSISTPRNSRLDIEKERKKQGPDVRGHDIVK